MQFTRGDVARSPAVREGDVVVVDDTLCFHAWLTLLGAAVIRSYTVVISEFLGATG